MLLLDSRFAGSIASLGRLVKFASVEFSVAIHIPQPKNHIKGCGTVITSMDGLPYPPCRIILLQLPANQTAYARDTGSLIWLLNLRLNDYLIPHRLKGIG